MALKTSSSQGLDDICNLDSKARVTGTKQLDDDDAAVDDDDVDDAAAVFVDCLLALQTLLALLVLTKEGRVAILMEFVGGKWERRLATTINDDEDDADEAEYFLIVRFILYYFSGTSPEIEK